MLTGKRKSSIARVYLDNKSKNILVNGKKVEEYFTRSTHLTSIYRPLVMTEQKGKIGVVVNVHGGGLTGQAEAIRHGISKALVDLNESMRSILKPEGLLTRDARKVERKKPGFRKARRKRQFSKR
jgi:small subunit ribosomal protein S9